MMRRHGWQLPAHTFQVVAITVFFMLVVAFYAFFAPFLGGHIFQYAAMAIYSPVVLLVFILYVRCTAINPADPGIMFKFDGDVVNNKPNKNLGLSSLDMPGDVGKIGIGAQLSPSSVSRSSVAADSYKRGSYGEAVIVNIPVAPTSTSLSCFNIGGLFCALFTYEDCRKHGEPTEQQIAVEDALYCTLCNAEVRKFSKHCRSCDKCVDGFDHHCRWLNNCVGRKNYVTFISLMSTSLVWLILEAGVGIAVFVRCFLDKKDMENQIIERLGDGFSRAPFATVVALCSVVSLLACVPLGELLFFHMILIRKGITTYEYVVAMRAMSEAPAGASVDEEMANVLYSPSGSATSGVSGGSSLSLQYKGVWCTPPRVFVDYQDEVIPHLDPRMVPSTVDPDATGFADKGNKFPKKPVRISAWKLAKLDSNDAVRAAAKARASSSVLRPLDNSRLPDHDFSSSENMSVRSSTSADTGMNRERKNDLKLSPLRNSYAPSHGSLDEYETGTPSMSSFSSPGHAHELVTPSPFPVEQPLGSFNPTTPAPRFLPDRPFNTLRALPGSNLNNPVFHSSSTSGFDDKLMQKGNTADPFLMPPPPTSLLRDGKRTSVIWDQEAGRYVSVPVSARVPDSAFEARIRSLFPNPNSELSSYGRRPTVPRLESSTVMNPPLQQAGESIFFGGPLLNVQAKESPRSETTTSFILDHERVTSNWPLDSRVGRGEASNQIPVFNPKGSERDPPFHG